MTGKLEEVRLTYQGGKIVAALQETDVKGEIDDECSRLGQVKRGAPVI